MWEHALSLRIHLMSRENPHNYLCNHHKIGALCHSLCQTCWLLSFLIKKSPAFLKLSDMKNHATNMMILERRSDKNDLFPIQIFTTFWVDSKFSCLSLCYALKSPLLTPSAFLSFENNLTPVFNVKPLWTLLEVRDFLIKREQVEYLVWTFWKACLRRADSWDMNP